MGLKIFIFFALLFQPRLFAHSPDIDPFNTYQFNRLNYLSGSEKVDTKPWFEWWYYKVVLPEKNKSYYFVYGVVNPWDLKQSSEASRSYVGMGSFKDKKTLEQRFKVRDFHASYEKTQVNVGVSNQATDTHLVGNINDPKGITSQWNINVQKKWAFNATDWATGLNITNIEWYPAQADARCSGEITFDGVTEKFVDAPCYQDRNWGSLFPQWWAWIVSNHFENSPGSTLAIGGGKPTFLDTYNDFEGVAIGLKTGGRTYAWRPHNGDEIKFNIKMGVWELEAISEYYKIKVSAQAPLEKFMDLQFMTPQGSVFHDFEALDGSVSVELYERYLPGFDWTLVTHLKSNHAGIEYGSDSPTLFKELKRSNLCLFGCKK